MEVALVFRGVFMPTVEICVVFRSNSVDGMTFVPTKARVLIITPKSDP